MDKLNIDRRSVTPIVDAMQYDAGRQAEFTLTEDMTNKYAEYSFKISEDRTVKGHCDISEDNVAFFVIPQNVTCKIGDYPGSITFYDSSELDNAISSFPFIVSVTKNPKQDGDVYETALTDMINATNAAVSAAESANTAASNADSKASAAEQAAENANSKASAANSAAQAAESAASSAQNLIDQMNNILDKWGDADFSAVLNTISDLQDKTSTLETKTTTLENWKNSVDGGNDDVMIEV